jgi:hypothetical protein
MAHGITGLVALSMIGAMVVTGPVWGQTAGAQGEQVSPSTSTPKTPAPSNSKEPEADIGDRSGSTVVCHMRYSSDARQIGPATGDQEKDNQAFTLIGMDCPARP